MSVLFGNEPSSARAPTTRRSPPYTFYKLRNQCKRERSSLLETCKYGFEHQQQEVLHIHTSWITCLDTGGKKKKTDFLSQKLNVQHTDTIQKKKRNEVLNDRHVLSEQNHTEHPNLMSIRRRTDQSLSLHPSWQTDQLKPGSD